MPAGLGSRVFVKQGWLIRYPALCAWRDSNEVFAKVTLIFESRYLICKDINDIIHIANAMINVICSEYPFMEGKLFLWYKSSN